MSCNQVVSTSCTFFFFHICFSLAVWINSMLSSTMTQIQMSTWWRTWAAWTGWVGLSLLPNFVLQLVQKTTKKVSGITEGSCFNCSKSLSTKMCVCANGWANSDHSPPKKENLSISPCSLVSLLLLPLHCTIIQMKSWTEPWEKPFIVLSVSFGLSNCS